MADFNSSLPVRTEAAGDVKVQLVDKTTTSQAAAVDSSGNVSVLVQNTTGSPANVQDLADGPVSPGTAATKSMLGGAVYNSSAPALTTGQQASLQANSSGSLKVDGSAVTQPVSAASLPLPTGAATESSLAKLTISPSTALGSNTGALVQGSVTTAAPSYTTGNINPLSLTTAGALRVDGSGSTQPVSFTVDGSAVSKTNPMPVYMQDSPGTEVNNYNTATVASAGTSNHDYTVTAATTLRMSQIWASSSGKLKIEVQVESGVASGTFSTRFVAFNSTGTPNIQIPVNELISVAAGVRVRVIRTNLDKSSEDVYTTICGHEQA